MLSENDLIKGCQEFKIKAQEELYNLYSKKMYSVCYYYLGSADDANDIMHEGFIKIFSKIGKYKGEGSFEGWMRRLMVNLSIDFLKKNKTRPDSVYNSSAEMISDQEYLKIEEYEIPDSEMDYTQEEIFALIDKLPEEYRLVFNLCCLENYSHKEIAELLVIKEDTSRSRLRRAREFLKKHLNELSKEKGLKQNYNNNF